LPEAGKGNLGENAPIAQGGVQPGFRNFLLNDDIRREGELTRWCDENAKMGFDKLRPDRQLLTWEHGHVAIPTLEA